MLLSPSKFCLPVELLFLRSFGSIDLYLSLTTSAALIPFKYYNFLADTMFYNDSCIFLGESEASLRFLLNPNSLSFFSLSLEPRSVYLCPEECIDMFDLRSDATPPAINYLFFSSIGNVPILYEDPISLRVPPSC